MIANVEDVIKWLLINDLDYWRVKVKDGDNATVFETSEALNRDDNLARFRQVMDLCQGNRFTIMANAKKGIQKGNYFEEFRNLRDAATPSAIGGLQQPLATVGMVPIDEVDRKIQEAIRSERLTRKMEEQEAEIKELRQIVREKDNVTTRFMEKLDPYIGSILTQVVRKIVPQAPQVELAGLEYAPHQEHQPDMETETNNEQSADVQRLEAALKIWSQADPDFINLIEAVANLAHTKDPMYTMAKNMLGK